MICYDLWYCINTLLLLVELLEHEEFLLARLERLALDKDKDQRQDGSPKKTALCLLLLVAATVILGALVRHR
jgi:hypothetical protein